MTNRPEFNLDYINKELEKLEKAITKPLNVYVAGGYVMASLGLKAGTKDIDVVLQNKSQTEKLGFALEKSGYARLPDRSVTKAYQDLSAVIYENQDGFRWDVFTKIVANKLALTEGMRERAKIARSSGMLSIFELSKEDIFLMKGVTDRERDLDDMLLIARSGADYETVFEECLNQSKTTGRLWESALHDKCSELEEKFGVTVPITRKLRKVAEEQMLLKRILPSLKKPRTQGELVTATKLKPSDIKAGIRILKKQGKIRISKRGKISLKTTPVPKAVGT